MIRKTYGFTIVELLVVIVVIAILTGVSTVAFSGVQQRARDTARISALKDYAKALQLYFIQNGRYPGGLANVTSGNPLLCLDGSATCYASSADGVMSAALKSELSTVISSFPEFQKGFFSYGSISSTGYTSWTGYYIQFYGFGRSCPEVGGVVIRGIMGGPQDYTCRYGLPSN